MINKDEMTFEKVELYKEEPEQKLRRQALIDFWKTGKKIAVLPVYQPDSMTREMNRYEKASKQLRLGFDCLRFYRRKRMIVAERQVEADEGRAIHELKVLPEYFAEIKSRTKRFELRKDDRDYKVDDTLILNEWDGDAPTGEQYRTTVRYILRNCPEYGLMDGYCILGF